MKRWLLLCCLVLLAPFAGAASLLAGESGSFVFNDPGYFARKPLTVYYYKPRSARSDARVLIAIHGAERKGATARDNWKAFAEQHAVIVLAPEFDQKRYPNRLFQMGGLADRDSSHWTFTLIEHLFDKLRGDEGLSATRYWLFGHSGGGQFVHRMVLAMPQARYSLAIAANPGAYTLPVYNTALPGFAWPWELDPRYLEEAQLRTSLGRRFVLLLGEDDTRSDDSVLPRQPQALAQGPNRLARGRHFFGLAREQAAGMNADFGWELATVPHVGHNARGMSRAAAGYFLSGG
jgi:hypothetical protein